MRDGVLPLARARNLGAAHALEHGAELLIFLDVDCIPGEQLIDRYAQAARDPAHHRSLLCGTVAYLLPPPSAGYRLTDLPTLAGLHPDRPAPAPGETRQSTDHTLFWSLSFALTQWRRPRRSWMRRSQSGAHQLTFPNSRMRAGMSRVRTMNASTRTASVSPTPSIFR